MYLVGVAKHVDTIVVGSFEVNCYLVWDDQTKDLLVIDPGDEAISIAGRINLSGCSPRAILLTHAHGDHIAGVAELRSQYQIPLVAGENERAYLSDPMLNLSSEIGHPISLAPAERWVGDDDVISYGSLAFRVLATPGHTSGGVCYLDEEHGRLFCGDTIFQGSIGRTDFRGGSFNDLMQSIRQ